MESNEFEDLYKRFDNDYHLSEEEIEAIQYSVLDDATKIIQYFEEKEKNDRHNWWKRLLLNVISWFVGVLTALLVQYLIKFLKLQ